MKPTFTQIYERHTVQGKVARGWRPISPDVTVYNHGSKVVSLYASDRDTVLMRFEDGRMAGAPRSDCPTYFASGSLEDRAIAAITTLGNALYDSQGNPVHAPAAAWDTYELWGGWFEDMKQGKCSIAATLKFDMGRAIADLEAGVARFLEEIANGKDKS
jgi:hypothetical protein